MNAQGFRTGQSIKSAAITVCLILSSISFTHASAGSDPKWVSAHGYWVVESNLNSPGNQTIFFYALNNELMYRETLTGTTLKLRRRKVKIKLKKALEQVYAEWENKKVFHENQSLVMNILGH